MTTENKTEQKEFKIVKKVSPFRADPFNFRGGKGGNKGMVSSNSAGAMRSGKTINVSKPKGGSGGDR